MSSEIKVGVIVVAALALLTYFMVNTGDWDLFGDGKKTYQVVCRFNNVVGLNTGAGVSLSGVKIGQVSDIRLEGHKALVVMLINDSVDFPSTSEARISSVGLLGQAAVEIIPDEIGRSSRSARETGEIGSRDPVTVDQLVAVLQSIGDEGTDLVASVRDFLYGNEAVMANILENLRVFTEDLDVLINENRSAINESLDSINVLTGQLKEDLPTILENVKVMSAGLKDVVEQHSGDVGESLESTKALIKKLDTAAVTMQEILDKINEGEGSVSQLLNDPYTLEQTNEVLERAGSVIQDFETFIKSPTNITFDYGFRAEYFNRSEDFKYYYRLTTHFNPTDSMLIELINDQVHNKPPIFDPDAADPSDDQALEFLGDDFTFSATYGRKIPGGVLRVGLIENETGLALDLGSPNDNFIFSLEGYDFGRDKGPHFKASLSFKVWGGFYVNLGYDDPVDDSKAQWFYGGGFRF